VSGACAAVGRRRRSRGAHAASEIWIVEIKCLDEDFRADGKWMDYRALRPAVFATNAHVPCEIFPKDTGLIVPMRSGARIVCEAPEHRLHARAQEHDARLARCAALRRAALADPAGPFAAEF